MSKREYQTLFKFLKVSYFENDQEDSKFENLNLSNTASNQKTYLQENWKDSNQAQTLLLQRLS